jgi:CHAT domain-containing protein/tetratricopeptide (TPR) repeat protein
VLAWSTLAVTCALLIGSPASARQQAAPGPVVGAGDASPRGLIAQGDGERLKGRYSEALALYDSAWSAAEVASDTAAAAAALTGMARVHTARGAYDLASDLAQQSLALRPETERSAEAAVTLIALANIQQNRGDYDASLDFCQRSLSIQEHRADPLGIATALSCIGVANRRLGRLDDATAAYERALSLLRGSPEKVQLARTLNNLGVLQVARGDYAAALDAYRESLPLHESLGHTPDVAGTLVNMAIAWRLLGNNRLALEYHQKGLAMAERTGSPQMIADGLSETGRSYASQGQTAIALEYYQRALTINEALGRRGESALQHSYIAAVLAGRGEIDAALAMHQQSLKTREAIGDRATAAASWSNIAALHDRRGDFDRAVECWTTSLRLHEEVGNRQGMANVVMQLSRVASRQGNHADALETAERALVLSRATGGRRSLRSALVRVGQARQALGQRAQAREAFEEAVAVAESLRDDTAGGESERQAGFEQSLSPYQALVALLIEEHLPHEALLMAERAKARVLLDVLGQGRVNVTKAMTAAEVRDERDIERELIALNAQIAYRSRGSGRDDAQVASLTERLRATQSRREAFRLNLYAAHPELKVQRSDVPPLTAADAAALLGEGEARTAILEFVVTADATYVFVTRRHPSRAGRASDAPGSTDSTSATGGPGIDVVVATVRIARGELVALTAKLRDQLAARDPGFRDASATLFDLLVAPVRAHLKDAGRLIIVPDGVLWELPFQALWQSDRGGYLLESHAISYAPSITVLREMTRVKASRAAERGVAGPPRLLAFANPLLPAENRSVVEGAARDAPLAPLPHAELEVRGLQRVYGPAASRIHVGPAAREDRWKNEARDFTVLHLATHGVLDATSPMYSYLALAPSPAAPPLHAPAAAKPSALSSSPGGPGDDSPSDDDGLLQAWELMALDLRAELVVLSACETARGRVAPGEGLIGLSWALFVAGSPASIVSQWKVESASTAELMQQFHSRWRGIRVAPGAARTAAAGAGARLSKAEALQQAALPLLRGVRYRHPFYWAGFVLVGDGS